MRVVFTTVTLLIASISPALTADGQASEFICVPESVSRDFLETQYLTVERVRDEGKLRIYRASRDDTVYSVTIDACTSELLSETPER
jgi:hypothetical protein